MKLSWVEFNWNVPYIRPDNGKGDYKRTFRAPEHDLEIDYAHGVIRIDGRETSTGGAVWETQFAHVKLGDHVTDGRGIVGKVDFLDRRARTANVELDAHEGHLGGIPVENLRVIEHGSDQPGEPVGPARGARKKR